MGGGQDHGFDDDEDDGDSGPVIAMSFETCQICGWKGLSMGDEWDCPKCKTTWEAVTFMVPKADMDDFCGKAADALGGYFQRIRPSNKEAGRDD